MKLSKLSKNELYIACLQEGFIMPKITSTACRMQYLVSVRSGNEYCPQKNEIHQSFECDNPPKKIILLQIIYDLLQQKGDPRTLSFDEKHLPDVDWCLQAICALDPEHPIFEPGYKPAIQEKGRRGRKFAPKAEDLVFMIDYQSGSSNKTQVQSSIPLQKNTCQERKKKSQAQIKNCNQIDKYIFEKSEIQESQMGACKQNISNVTSPCKIDNVDMNHNAQEIQSSQYEKQKPLVKMLKALEKKGLLDDYFLQFIHNQEPQELNNEQSQKQFQESNSSRIRMIGSKTQNYQNYHQNEIVSVNSHSNQQSVKQNLIVKRENFYEEDKDEESPKQILDKKTKRIQNNNKYDIWSIKQHKKPVLIERTTMNKLLDESQLNSDEYEEVHVQEPSQQEFGIDQSDRSSGIQQKEIFNESETKNND